MDTSGIERPASEYSTLNEFFARRLRPGARPIHRPRCALLLHPSHAKEALTVGFPRLVSQPWSMRMQGRRSWSAAGGLQAARL